MPSPWFPKRILVSHTLHEGLGDYLTERRPDLEVRARDAQAITAEDVAWCEVLVGFRPPREGRWRELRWIHCIGAGVDAFGFRTGLSPTTLLTRTSEDFGPMIGEYCLARALAVTQRLRALDADQREKRWRPKHPARLRDTRAVIVGTGAVGRGIARTFVAAGCRVDGISRTGTAREPFDRVFPIARFEEAIPHTHWLILASPLTEATFHLLDRGRLALCKGVYLINVGRGQLIDEPALPEALEAGQLSGCALDVFEVEPPPPDSSLWTHPAVTISPHISGLTTIPGAGDGFLSCLAEVETGKIPSLAVELDQGY